ncbi:hypothetical protein PF005_g28960 [Phytophthora fragariae]|uniref:Uncharacterized protein n=1 Tax=Phytophthora fragariae TaxID=53985 RepID=A0A6A3HAG5_9STRA|nr:hypothetical protein PF003_g13672 [Phytophthora fragariae]KAE8930472.1 hypothetical protein PF009_g19435 [Phytophthora fragariae]KAE8966167.1 hypothetical protein PF011_g28035 [Phytophthora fragariae]KAE9065044.1 hypothetical protein PF010_g28371 [Phytophthora fragariae]KAE9065472.1 hypothetical protein PF007_g28832 [Phytophthora fragariae]
MARSGDAGDKSSKSFDEAAGCERGDVAGGDPPASDAAEESSDLPEDPSEFLPSSEPGGDGLPSSPLFGDEPPAGDPG